MPPPNKALQRIRPKLERRAGRQVTSSMVNTSGGHLAASATKWLTIAVLTSGHVAGVAFLRESRRRPSA
jgi:hypothetical protein